MTNAEKLNARLNNAYHAVDRACVAWANEDHEVWEALSNVRATLDVLRRHRRAS